MKKKSPPTSLRIISVLFPIAAAIVGIATANNNTVRLAFYKQFAPNVIIRETSRLTNERLPIQVDQLTRWDRTEALPNVTLQYYHTILSENVDADALSDAMTPRLVKMYRENNDMQPMRDIGATLIYCYSDIAGNQITKITISPDML